MALRLAISRCWLKDDVQTADCIACNLVAACHQKPFFLLPPDIAYPSQLLVVSYPPLVSGPAPLVPKRHTDTHIATRGQHGGVGLPSLERVRAPSSQCTSLLISVSRLAGGNSASSIPRGSHAGPPFQTMSPSPHFHGSSSRAISSLSHPNSTVQYRTK